MPTVDPTIGPAAAGAAPPRLHAARQRRARRPRTQLGDPGFLDAQRLVDRQADDGVDVLGPTRLADHGQARAGAGLDAQHVQVDWEHRHATGPAGKTRRSWTPAVDTRENPVMQVKVSSQDCRRCDHVTPCIRPKPRAPRRTLTIRPQPPYQALQTARQREATEAFQAA
jgi:transposase